MTANTTHLRSHVLNTALSLVTEDRNDAYGEPEDALPKIAAYWSTYLGYNITAQDVATMMVLLKVARVRGAATSTDTWIDIAGYASLAAAVQGVEAIA